jgi:hypothetical protein
MLIGAVFVWKVTLLKTTKNIYDKKKLISFKLAVITYIEFHKVTNSKKPGKIS